MEFRLPDLGEGLEEAEVVEWLVAEGAVVERDQPLVAVSTDKAVVELPAPVAGRVSERRGAAGERLRVGDVVAVIEEVVAVGATPAPRPASRPRAAPAVRRLAVELGVDLQAVAPSGPDGRILADDVRRAANGGAAPQPPPSPPPPASAPAPAAPPCVGQASPGRHPLTGIRRRTAAVVASAWSSIPHIANMDEVDATALLDARERLRRAAGEQADLVGVMPLLVMAVARTLRRFPLVNAHLDADAGEVDVHADVHLGLAVASPDGLVVPVVRHADRRGLLDLAAEIARLVGAARSRGLRHSELEGATCTVTNFGALGAGRFSVPIIRPPEVAIIGFGAIAPRPLVVDGQVAARPALPYVVTVDHRVLDGDAVCGVSAALAETLADPLSLLLG